VKTFGKTRRKTALVDVVMNQFVAEKVCMLWIDEKRGRGSFFVADLDISGIDRFPTSLSSHDHLVIRKQIFVLPD